MAAGPADSKGSTAPCTDSGFVGATRVIPPSAVVSKRGWVEVTPSIPSELSTEGQTELDPDVERSTEGTDCREGVFSNEVES